MVSYTRQIFDPPASDVDNGMFLEVMSFTRNVSRHFDSVRQSHTSDLA